MDSLLSEPDRAKALPALAKNITLLCFLRVAPLIPTKISNLYELLFLILYTPHTKQSFVFGFAKSYQGGSPVSLRKTWLQP